MQPSRAARSSTCRAAAAAGVTVSASRASAPRPKNGAYAAATVASADGLPRTTVVSERIMSSAGGAGHT